MLIANKYNLGFLRSIKRHTLAKTRVPRKNINKVEVGS